MKRVKSGKKKQAILSDDGDYEEENSPKRKIPEKPKKPKNQKKKQKEQEENVKEDKPELTFTGIGEKDPSLNEIKVEEREYPFWLRPEHREDAQGRPYKEGTDYDCSTLRIPEKEFNKMSPIFKQYWEIKSKNYDKIVFFKMGMPFFCFYDDAVIVGDIGDFKVQFWGTRPYVVIFPKYYKFYQDKLISLGYKVVTVEQTETESSREDNILKREIVEILSKGTVNDYSTEKEHSDQKFLLCILQKKNKFGITFVDCMTQNFFLDEVSQIEDLKTIIYRVKPVEVVTIKGFLDFNVMSFIKNVSSNPAFSQCCIVMPTIDEIFKEWEAFFKSKTKNINFIQKILDDRELPKIFKEIKNAFMKEKQKNSFEIAEENIPNFYLIQALYLCFSYLKGNLIVDSTFLYGNFSFFNLESLKRQRLYMDSSALRNLEIFDVNCESKLLNQNSLFHFIDKTKTGYGKRLMKKWLESPLRNINDINERLDAIEDLHKNCNIADYFHSKIVKLPDFERALGRIYNATNKQKLAFSTFDNFASNKLNDFFNLLDAFDTVFDIIDSFGEYKTKFKSSRLKKIVTIKKNEKDEKGLFPDIVSLKKEISSMVEFNNDIVVPKLGTNERYDNVAHKIKGVQDKLNEILLQLRKKLKCSDLNFNHNKIRRYEIEVPEALSSSMPSDFNLTSKRKGIMRYQNALIENFIQELESYETSLNEILAPFFMDVFKKFYEKQTFWLQAISLLAELDCLVGLSKHITDMSPYSCRPIFTEDKNVFRLQQVFHPCLIEFVPKFVPNDIEFSKDIQALLITGPNMGGKSTILRQACVAIILAQIGSYVPAKSFLLSPFDRIFCRIGANDKILEGKSTFFMEMEESGAIINDATDESFVIFDELGRGTSTYDGVALAYGVLKYVVENIKCKTMFSTHYHLLVDEFMLFQGVKSFYMDFKYNEEKEEIEFYYKFVEGEACKSFGINVAKIVGVPKEVLEIAKVKAQSLNAELENVMGTKKIAEKFNECLRFLTNE